MSLHTTFQRYIYVPYNQKGAHESRNLMSQQESLRMDAELLPSPLLSFVCGVHHALRYWFNVNFLPKYWSWEIFLFEECVVPTEKWFDLSTQATYSLLSHQLEESSSPYTGQTHSWPLTSLPIAPCRIPASNHQQLIFCLVPQSASICSPSFEKTTATTERPTC